ncbi:hypothetical protein ACFV6F_06225 [Kitasatospora phosalacinea]|uniref:hypothetical protein n=1 Tax=Kitasatospora phosalacinea TaxID=2065 RepID=UPI003666DC1C
MRGRRQWWVAAVAVAVVLGGAGCSAGGGGTGPKTLRDGLLTEERLPEGYALFPGESDGTSALAADDPDEEDGPEPLASMPCVDLGVDPFVTLHAPPLEVAGVGIAPAAEGDRGAGPDWYGRETLGRYPSGGAAKVLAELRRTALRCAVSTDVSPDGSNRIDQFVTAEPFGTGLLLTVTTRAGATRESLTDRTAVLRDGDVLLVVQEIGGEEDSTGLPGLVDAAAAAYRDAAGR